MARSEVVYKTFKDGITRPFNYKAVEGVFTELCDVEIGRFFVSEESERKIKDLLGLDNRTDEDDIRGIRNAVVEMIYKVEMQETNLTENGEAIPGKQVNYERMTYWSNKMSGITAVIDETLWNNGYRV